ncbi:MAG TPA: bifunctional DNA-formamidopyrimidine glycosylase/DNA-(apurinic or apyrimidinic site) lyase [bacterium]|jgi:formamidopyrimidine-DNA glycosylase|nr:bifunctional DNA-formamidopyrimidine glycosylase/DNA-(apurinic or apyrimidinic site) lyase [bacterium]HQG78796.1 bifunctional DNA-formamidopyrimidine glycosylase/DNA-(apurinic or apyrimidinic site) lyase [bacterium]HQK41459.1 bifunctional DNA-formamidopyrimidine glycosylase/DNA-(apurinic or apyrimidinic site) lyase [bacterium]
MPELPEVHTISQDLKNNIVGYKIENIQIERNYKIPEIEKIRLGKIKDKKISDVERIAKNIVIKLFENEFLVFHLAMTGRIILTPLKEKKDKWTKIVFKISKNEDEKYLKFCDMRQFGKIKVLDEKSLSELRNKYGLDILEADITPDEFLRIIKSKNTNIKNALMDQEIISGVGNIYATDALFLSGINPKTRTKDMNLQKSEKLLNSLKEILREGIKNRGATLPDEMYVDIFGKPGNQQKYFKIYGKKICPRCGAHVFFEKINGRGTYFCPVCQPLIDGKTKNLQKTNQQKSLL